MRAEVVRQLQCDVSDAAGSRMDEYRLLCLQVGAFDQRLPRGDQNQRQRCGILQAEVRRFRRAVFFVQRGVFGVVARLVAQPAVAEIHLVADLESRQLRCRFLRRRLRRRSPEWPEACPDGRQASRAAWCPPGSRRRRRASRGYGAARAVRVSGCRAIAARRCRRGRWQVWLSSASQR